MVNNTSEQTISSNATEPDDVKQAVKENDQEKINKALRQKYEREMVIYEEQTNAILDGVRQKGVSTSSEDVKKKLPEMITDIHILFSVQNPEYVYEGVDTSKDLEKELGQTLDEKIKEAQNKKKDEDSNTSEETNS